MNGLFPRESIIQINIFGNKLKNHFIKSLTYLKFLSVDIFSSIGHNYTYFTIKWNNLDSTEILVIYCFINFFPKHLTVYYFLIKIAEIFFYLALLCFIYFVFHTYYMIVFFQNIITNAYLKYNHVIKN